jgi:UDP:flavonoid glycosyltransferase YjiC (YdhE family)
VLVTQGTLATDVRELIGPALQALAREDLLVVAASVPDPGLLGPLPGNARTAAFVPFGALLPHVAAYVTNGGYGGVQQALAHGVPVVVAGDSEDKAEVANRVQYAGVGINLGTARPTPAQVQRAVRAVLAGPQRQRAAALGKEMRRQDAVRRAADLLELLARSGQPVLRNAADNSG